MKRATKPEPTADSWELTVEERSSFLLVAQTLAMAKPPVSLDDIISDHETRDRVRRAFEKLLARADSRRVMTAPEKELAYLKERIHDAKGWMRLGLTHKLWGSIEDAYAGLDNGRVPPVRRWRAAGAKKARTKR